MANPNVIKLISLMSASRRHICEKFNRTKGLDPTTFIQIETLRFIMERKNPKMKDVASYLNITPPSATSIIDGLVKTKMIERNFSSTDRRTVRLAITTKGKNYATKCFNDLSKGMEESLAKLTQKEQKQLINLHYKLFGLNNQ